MRKIMIAAVLLAAACAPVHAASETEVKCRALSVLGGKVMVGRQAGVSAADAVEQLGDFVWLWDEAYKVPRYQGDKMQRQAKQDFENHVYMKCRSWLNG